MEMVWLNVLCNIRRYASFHQFQYTKWRGRIKKSTQKVFEHGFSHAKRNEKYRRREKKHFVLRERLITFSTTVKYIFIILGNEQSHWAVADSVTVSFFMSVCVCICMGRWPKSHYSYLIQKFNFFDKQRFFFSLSHSVILHSKLVIMFGESKRSKEQTQKKE